MKNILLLGVGLLAGYIFANRKNIVPQSQSNNIKSIIADENDIIINTKNFALPNLDKVTKIEITAINADKKTGFVTIYYNDGNKIMMGIDSFLKYQKVKDVPLIIE